MRHAKSRLVEGADESAPVRLETAPTGLERMRFLTAPTGDESVYLFLEFTIIGFSTSSTGA